MTLPMHRKSVQCMIGVCDWDYHCHCEERSDVAIRISCGA